LACYAGYDEEAQLEFLKTKVAPRLQRCFAGRWNFSTVAEAEVVVRATDLDQNMMWEASQDGKRESNRRTHAADRTQDPTPSTTTHTSRRTPLITAERERLTRIGGCFFCRKEGHIMGDCPVRPSRTTPPSKPTSGTRVASTTTADDDNKTVVDQGKD
jgi:hypothetical protein